MRSLASQAPDRAPKRGRKLVLLCKENVSQNDKTYCALFGDEVFGERLALFNDFFAVSF